MPLPSAPAHLPVSQPSTAVNLKRYLGLCLDLHCCKTSAGERSDLFLSGEEASRLHHVYPGKAPLPGAFAVSNTAVCRVNGSCGPGGWLAQFCDFHGDMTALGCGHPEL